MTGSRPQDFSVGERWSYQTRVGEEGSTFVVGQIDEMAGGVIVHVRIDGLHLRGRRPQTQIGHVPMERSALVDCRDALVETGVAVGDEFARGYRYFREYAEAEPFDIPLRDVVDGVETTILDAES